MSALLAKLGAWLLGKLAFRSWRFWHFVADAAAIVVLVLVSRFRPLTFVEWGLIALLVAHHAEAWLESLFAEIDQA